ncbi:hypothetical protein ACTFIV_007133 [Dictyostelium citrinum]
MKISHHLQNQPSATTNYIHPLSAKKKSSLIVNPIDVLINFTKFNVSMTSVYQKKKKKKELKNNNQTIKISSQPKSIIHIQQIIPKLSSYFTSLTVIISIKTLMI